jgi:succinate-semialdehyde dehydrogenase/glutarate-semialdehyde dehydrogenase
VRIAGAGRWRRHGASPVLTMKQPVGPCLFITPVELPMRWAPARSAPRSRRLHDGGQAGRPDPAVDVRASRQILTEAGCPTGVLNVITTFHDGRVWSRSSGTRGCGSCLHRVDGGRQEARRAVPRSSCCRVSMELGGQRAVPGLRDADLDAAVDGAMLAKMRNMARPAPRRTGFVHRVRAPEFSPAAGRAGWAPCASGAAPEDGGGRGARSSDAPSREKGSPSWFEDAVDAVARVLVGGNSVGDRGYFYAPHGCWPTSPRGPGCCARRSSARSRRSSTFAATTRRLRLANDTEYGLVAYAYTRTCSGRCASSRAWRPAWSASTRASSPTRRAVRRRQAVRLRPRGRRRGHRGVPRDQVRRHPL